MNKLKQLNKNHLCFFFILLLGLILRFYQLDLRVIHHDESLHAMYSLYYFKDSANMYYKYNPLLHGPFLYHTLPWFMWIFGVTKLAFRMPAFILGSLLIFLPLIFKRYLNNKTLLMSSLLIAISPSLTYWSRFIRHDNFIFASLFLAIFSLIQLKGRIRIFAIAISLAISFCTKENSYIHLIFLITYLAYEAFIIRSLQIKNSSLLLNLINHIKQNAIAYFISVVIFTFIFCHYYSAGFTYSQGILDGLYRKSLTYWFDQHQQERITGPFSYQFLINSSFEIWWPILLLCHFIRFYWRQLNFSHFLIVFTFIISVSCHLFFKTPHYPNFISKILKIKIPFDFYLYFPLIIHSIIFTTTAILEKNRPRALSGFFFFSSFFTYSYLGEKVPWLALYPLLSGLVFFMFEFNQYKNKKVINCLFIILCVHALGTNLWTNFYHAEDPINLLSQVHTTKIFDQKMLNLREKMIQNKSYFFLVEQAPTWPTTWYMRNLTGYHFNKLKTQYKEYQYILTDPSNHRLTKILQNEFTSEVLPLRSWWLPSYHEINLTRFLSYIIYKKNWNPSGAQQVTLWTKK